MFETIIVFLFSEIWKHADRHERCDINCLQSNHRPSVYCSWHCVPGNRSPVNTNTWARIAIICLHLRNDFRKCEIMPTCRLFCLHSIRARKHSHPISAARTFDLWSYILLSADSKHLSYYTSHQQEINIYIRFFYKSQTTPRSFKPYRLPPLPNPRNLVRLISDIVETLSLSPWTSPGFLWLCSLQLSVPSRELYTHNESPEKGPIHSKESLPRFKLISKLSD